MGVYHFHEFPPTFQLFARQVGISLHTHAHTSHTLAVTLMHGTHTYAHIFFPCVNVAMQIGIHNNISTVVYTTHEYIYARTHIRTRTHTRIRTYIQYVIYCHGTAKVYFLGHILSDRKSQLSPNQPTKIS